MASLTSDQMKEAFATFDVHNTGRLDAEALRLALKGLGFDPHKYTSGHCEELIAAIHVRHNRPLGDHLFSSIDYLQFEALVSSKMVARGSEEELALAFRLLDRDRSGCITLENLVDAVRWVKTAPGGGAEGWREKQYPHSTHHTTTEYNDDDEDAAGEGRQWWRLDNEEVLREMIVEADVLDNDGAVNFKEFKRIISAGGASSTVIVGGDGDTTTTAPAADFYPPEPLGVSDSSSHRPTVSAPFTTTNTRRIHWSEYTPTKNKAQADKVTPQPPATTSSSGPASLKSSKSQSHYARPTGQNSNSGSLVKSTSTPSYRFRN